MMEFIEGLDYSKLWVAWLALFVAIEGASLANKKKGDTLSEHVWDWFSVNEKGSRKRTIRMVGLFGFMAWLLVHFVSGGAI